MHLSDILCIDKGYFDALRLFCYHSFRESESLGFALAGRSNVIRVYLAFYYHKKYKVEFYY